MGILIWIGAAVTLAGVVVLAWCIRAALRFRRAALSPEESRAGLQRLAMVNMIALTLSGVGLMLVIIGLTFA